MDSATGTMRRVGGVAGTLLLSAGAAFAQGAARPAGGGAGFWELTAQTIVNPWVTILLLFAGCFLLFVDMLTPKTWEWTGSLGVLFVGAVFAAQVSEHTGGSFGILLMLAGVGLLLLETHVFPGGAVSAIAGIIALFCGMFVALGGSGRIGFSLPVASVLTVVTLFAFFAYLPKSPAWKQISQQMRSAQSATGYAVALQNPLSLLGQPGITLTALRPTGTADVGGVAVDVVTEGDFLDAGDAIIVTQVEAGRVVVEPVPASGNVPETAQTAAQA